MPTDFKRLVVGKKYKLNRELGGYFPEEGFVFECLYSGLNCIVMSRPTGRDWILYYDYNHHLVFDDYIEPRKEYFNAYLNTVSGGVFYDGGFVSEELADHAMTNNYNHCKYYGRLIMIHHSETHVDVEFHLKRGK